MKIIIILDFTSSEHQTPFNFSSSTESFDGHIYKGQKLIFHTYIVSQNDPSLLIFDKATCTNDSPLYNCFILHY